MCPFKLFLPSPVPTELFFGSELPAGKWSHCQAWGWMSQSLRACWTPLPRQYLILTLIRWPWWGEKRHLYLWNLQTSGFQKLNPANLHLMCHWGSKG